MFSTVKFFQHVTDDTSHWLLSSWWKSVTDLINIYLLLWFSLCFVFLRLAGLATSHPRPHGGKRKSPELRPLSEPCSPFCYLHLVSHWHLAALSLWDTFPQKLVCLKIYQYMIPWEQGHQYILIKLVKIMCRPFIHIKLLFSCFPSLKSLMLRKRWQ